MKAITHIEQSLAAALALGEAPGCPPKLASAIRHAVFPGGARIRPQLCLAVASACGNDDPLLADAAAVAIELLHCASLVHDDLPCFDDAPTRRGRASVHWAYGESLAVLAGDALIVLAFQTLGLAGGKSPQRMAEVLGVVAKGVGMPFGIVAGQAWESESRVSLKAYQRAKTGALFVAATAGGALAAGADPQPWVALGEWLGEAYQVADDLLDFQSDALRGSLNIVAILEASGASADVVWGACEFGSKHLNRAIAAAQKLPCDAGAVLLQLSGELREFFNLRTNR